MGMTIKEAAARAGKAELTIRRMVKAGKLPARLEDRPPWGPTYVIEDADLAAVMEPPSPLITVLPPEMGPPHPLPEQQMRAIREGITADFQQALGQMEAHLHAQWHEELTRLHEHITQVTHEVVQTVQAQKVQGEAHDREVLQTIRETLLERRPRSRSWWPWHRS